MRSLTTASILLILLLQASATGQITRPDPPATAAKYLDADRGTSVDEAVRIALSNNDDLLAMKKEAEAVRTRVGQASQRARPSVGFESRQQVGGGGDRNRTMVMGSIPLELGGRRDARITVAEREAEFAESLFAEKERRLAAEVREKFGSTLAKIRKLEVTEEVLLFAIEGYELVRAKVADGDTAPLEENMILVELNRLRSMREKDEGAVRISMLELRNLMGVGPESPLTLTGDFENIVEPLPSLSLATERALERRTDLQALKAAADFADSKIEQSKSDGRIDAALNLGYERMFDDFPRGGDNMVIFGLSFQLPYGNRNRDEIEAAVLDRQAAEQRLEFGELIVKREVASAFARYEFAVRALEIFRVGVTGEAFRNLEVIRQTYELGASSLIDYLGEQRRYLDYRSGLIDAQLEVYLAKVEMINAENSPELIVR